MKKILIFSTAYFPFVGGAEIAIKEIVDSVDDFEFDMITARMDKNLPKKEKVGNIVVYRIGIGWPKFDKYLLAFWGSRLAKKLHKKNKYTLTWSMMASYNSFAALSFKRDHKNIPFLLTLQEGDEVDYILERAKLLKSKFQAIFEEADFVQCISNYLADWARSMGVKSKIEVVPNGVDLNKFRDKDSDFDVNNFRKKIGINESEKIIFTASRLVKKNGIKDLIKGMQHLNSSHKLLIAGNGEEEQELKNTAKELKIEDRIVFLGLINQEELTKYYWISDVFCRPSLSEGQGIAFLEAMATGIPVIATPVGGIPDFLQDKETGLFCEVKNPKSIADKIELIFKDEKLREEIVSNARKMIKEKYNWGMISKDMKKIFINLA